MRTVLLTIAAACLALPAQAQSLASRVTAVGTGTVRLSYTAREGVCGNGEHNIQINDHRRITRNGDDDSPCLCLEGPVRLSLEVREGQVDRIRTRVGGSWGAASAGVTDLGRVAAPEAAAYLLDLARRATGRPGEDAVFAATLADSVTPWPDLLALARNDRVPSRTRKSAVFWLSQAAGDKATEGLQALAEDNSEDREVREAAVFGLSQLHNDTGVNALIHVATTNRDPEIRRKALFWLGQSDDPRALKLFEDILSN